MDWKESLEKELKSIVPLGYIASVLLIIIGVVMFMNPLQSLSILLWVLVIGMVIGGIGRLVVYAKASPMLKQGFTAVMGVLDLVCACVLGYFAISAPQMTDATLALFIGFLMGFYMIMAGINNLTGTTIVRRMGGSTGIMIASGILDIIAGILLLSVPQVGAFFLMIALGISCIAGGINLLAATIDAKNRAKAFKEFTDSNGKPFDPDDENFNSWWIG